MRKVLCTLTICAVLSLVSGEVKTQPATLQPSTAPAKSNIQCISATGGVLFAGTFGEGMFRSNDDAVTWEACSRGLTNVNVLSLATPRSGDLYAATFGGGVFRSSNRGDSWVAINAGLASLEVVSIAAQDGRLYAGTASRGVFRSDDHGRDWVYAGLNGMFINRITVAADGRVLAATDEGIYLLNDSGSWSPIYRSGRGREVRDIAVSASGQFFIATNGDGVLSSSDSGKSWSSNNSGFAELNAGALRFTGSDSILVGTSAGVYRSVDAGRTWSMLPAPMPSGGIRCIASSPDGTIYVGTLHGSVLRSHSAFWTMVDEDF